MEAYLRRTAIWYGGVGLLTAQVARSLALPPKYLRLVINEIEVMGVRSLGVALTAAIFTGMFTALWIAKTMPVKIAAVSATPSERTPITSISLMTRRKYFGGRARLRATCAASKPRPPYQIAVRLR